MAMYIQTNVASLNSQRNLSMTTNSLATVFQRLSSGYRINSSADDAAGLGISTSLNAQVRSFAVAERNTNDGISVLQTADGAASQITNILTRMRELAVQGANGILSSDDRTNIGAEFTQLQSEISRIANGTSFNGKQLLDGSLSNTPLSIQVGTGTTANDQIYLSVGGNFQAGSLGGGVDATTISVGGSNGAASLLAITNIDSALFNVSKTRATFGALMNRMQTSIYNVQSMSTNLSAANSRIKDVDIATETANMSRLQVLEQAGVSVLSQANQSPQLALKLLG